MNLEQSAVSLREQFPKDVRSDLQREEKRLKRFGTVAFGGFAVMIGVAICGFIYLIITELVLTGNKPIVGILIILFSVFTALTLAYVFWRAALEEKRAKLGMAPGREIGSTEQNEKLLDEGRFEPVPTSVVEDTTELLTKIRTKKLDQ